MSTDIRQLCRNCDQPLWDQKLDSKGDLCDACLKYEQDENKPNDR